MMLFTPGPQGSRQSSSSYMLRSLVAILCVVLILFAGAAQVLHIHAPDEAANPGCSLCAVAHVSALPVPVLAAHVVVEAIAAIHDPEPVAAPRRFFAFSLYVRPPPVLTSLA